jgi:hypothetical protein
VYSDALLLIDALERHDPTDLTELDTDALVNLYTLLSENHCSPVTVTTSTTSASE